MLMTTSRSIVLLLAFTAFVFGAIAIAAPDRATALLLSAATCAYAVAAVVGHLSLRRRR